MNDPKESVRIGAPPTQAPVMFIPSPKKRMRWEVPLAVAVVGVVLIGGISAVGYFRSHRDKPAAVAAPPSPTPSQAPSDPHGEKACQLNKEAAEQERLGDDATLRQILDEGKQSPNFDIRFEAQMLFDEQAISNAARKSNSSDLGLLLAGQRASIEMQTACVKAGLPG